MLQMPKETLDDLLKTYKRVDKLILDIENLSIQEIKEELEFLMVCHFSEAIFAATGREDVNVLERTLNSYIKHVDEPSADGYIKSLELYLKRNAKQNEDQDNR
ncbi:hypothetical protein G9U52_34345 [Paenibacillus sp. S3N08]|uniref:Uncharacterized protein n=2 Tax=Paenibacillus agricola TaxID=2716264 RepID=A0ABX0JL12_9BACL|nr:hypothetical protein [Paenibacillus agricola]